MKLFCTFLTLLLATTHIDGFAPIIPTAPKASSASAKLFAEPDLEAIAAGVQMFQVIRAPIKYIGPYPCLALRFPQVATDNQRKKGQAGVSLDFVLNTAANTNTIAESVASELKLSKVGSVRPGVGASEVVGATYMLGETQLDGNKEEEFMQGLTASALPVASPASAGMLGLSFMQSFAGVDFTWGTVEGDKIVREPTVDFYGGNVPGLVHQGRTRLKMDRVPGTDLILVKIEINGSPVTALLDTSSPITVMNQKAATAAGLTAKKIQDEKTAAANGDMLSVADGQGKRLDLIKTTDTATVQLDSSDDDASVDFGKAAMYVGDLPALQVLGQMGLESPPSVVLGLDVLALRPAMLLQAPNNELWIE